MSDTIHRMVTDRIIAALQRGTVPWRKPWNPAAGQPRSMTTGLPYRGINPFLLTLTGAEHGYESPYWGTYRQISQPRRPSPPRRTLHHRRVLEESRGEQRDPQTGETTIRTVPLLRYYRVFNASQADHLPERFHPAPGQHQPIAQPQAILDAYLASGPGSSTSPATGPTITRPATPSGCPSPLKFRTPEHYYATAFHEAGHSTGHPPGWTGPASLPSIISAPASTPAKNSPPR